VRLSRRFRKDVLPCSPFRERFGHIGQRRGRCGQDIRRHHEATKVRAVVTEAKATVLGPAWKQRGSFQTRERANVMSFEIDDSDLVTLPAFFHGMKRDVTPIPREIRLRSLNACIENVVAVVERAYDEVPLDESRDAPAVM